MKKNKIYRVRILPGGKPLGFREQGGGIYSDFNHALKSYDRLLARGSKVVFEQTEPVWEAVWYDETP